MHLLSALHKQNTPIEIGVFWPILCLGGIGFRFSVVGVDLGNLILQIMLNLFHFQELVDEYSGYDEQDDQADQIPPTKA